MTKKLAPVAIFIYKRPEHLRKTLGNLMLCPEFIDSPIIVFADGAKNSSDDEVVKKTRALAKEILGEHAEYHFQDTNIGLSNSVIQGVSDTINRYKKVIVIEDDLLVADNFLTYMNQALSRYENERLVYQISGYQFNTPQLANTHSAFFLPFTTSWGWATWKRSWDQFDPIVKGWETLKTDKNLRQRFNLEGNYDFYSMLLRQMQNKSDSWAIRWYWSVFIKKGLILYPPTTLVFNTGFDGSGTHGKGLVKKALKDTTKDNKLEIKLPDTLSIDEHNYLLTKKSLWKSNRGWLGYIVKKLRSIALHLN